MKNPYTDAVKLTRFKWLIKYSKMDIFGTSFFVMILALLMLIKAPEDWWSYGIIMPVFYGLNIIRWVYLHKKNVKAYFDWEDKFGGK